jgi:uncharacterized protein YlzI (FlbEa/FlbD family)
MGRKRKYPALMHPLTEGERQERWSLKAIAAYVRITLERGLNHEPFSLRHDSIEKIDYVADGKLTVTFFNGKKFDLTITESEEANVERTDSAS